MYAIRSYYECDYELNLTQAKIQYDRYNFRSGKFEYYKSFDFDVTRDMKYIYFSSTSGNSMEFVITSYSIHYTKLYEHEVRQKGEYVFILKKQLIQFVHWPAG